MPIEKDSVLEKVLLRLERLMERAVSHYAQRRGLRLETEALPRQALQWAADSSGLSGRVARQFIDDLTGRLGLKVGK